RGRREHGLWGEIEGLVEGGHARAGEFVEAGRRSELQDAQLLTRQGLAAPRARDQRSAHVLEPAHRPPRVLLGELREQDVVSALQLKEAGLAPGGVAAVRAGAGEGYGDCGRAAHALRSCAGCLELRPTAACAQ